MRVLPVDLASKRPWRAWAGAAACLVASVTACTQGWQAWQAYRQQSGIERRARQLEPLFGLARASAADDAAASAVPAYAADAAAVAKTAGFDIVGAFATLESAQVAGVRVAAFDILTADPAVRIDIEAPDHLAVIRYVAELNAANAAQVWALTRTQALPGTGSVTATISRSPVTMERYQELLNQVGMK